MGRGCNRYQRQGLMYETHDTHNNKMRENKKNLVQLSNPYLDGDRTKQTNQEAFNTTTTKNNRVSKAC